MVRCEAQQFLNEHKTVSEYTEFDKNKAPLKGAKSKANCKCTYVSFWGLATIIRGGFVLEDLGTYFQPNLTIFYPNSFFDTVYTSAYQTKGPQCVHVLMFGPDLELMIAEV